MRRGFFAQHDVGAEPQLLHHARPHVVDEHVGARHLVHEPGDVLRVLQVERDPALVGVHGQIRGRHAVPERRAPAARVVALGALHLDDVGAHAGEDAGGERAGEGAAQLDDADAFERQGHLRPPGRGEAMPAVLLHDEAGAGKVRGADEHAGVGHPLHEGLAGAGGVRHVGAELARPLGLRHLHHAVHEVAGEDGFAGLRRQPHAGVARRVAVGGLEAEMLVHLEGLVHEHGLAGLHDRRHAVGEAAGGVTPFLLLALPELEFRAHHDVLRLGEGRHPLPPTRRVFQPTWSTCRCVQRTKSTCSGVTPAARRSSR